MMGLRRASASAASVVSGAETLAIRLPLRNAREIISDASVMAYAPALCCRSASERHYGVGSACWRQGAGSRVHKPDGKRVCRRNPRSGYAHGVRKGGLVHDHLVG